MFRLQLGTGEPESNPAKQEFDEHDCAEFPRRTRERKEPRKGQRHDCCHTPEPSCSVVVYVDEKVWARCLWIETPFTRQDAEKVWVKTFKLFGFRRIEQPVSKD
jgi:hypothetical protein